MMMLINMQGRKVNMKKANLDIRKELKKANIPLWRLGIEQNCSEMTIVRRLRTELSENEKNIIRQQIRKITEEEMQKETAMKDFSRFNDFRCSHCGKLLGRFNGEAEIQCSRCKMINMLNSDKVSCQ